MNQVRRCLECGEDLEPEFTACWRCGAQQPFSWIGDGIQKAGGPGVQRTSDDTKEDNWDEHPDLRCSVPWQSGGPQVDVVYHATVGGKIWLIRINDFPAEPLYTLLIDGRETIHFNDWPTFWPRL